MAAEQPPQDRPARRYRLVNSLILLTFAAFFGVLALPAVCSLRDAATNHRSQMNLKQIGLAIHNYYSDHQRLPGPVRDKNGRALLSWRVTILPYFESDSGPRFHLDEPWDSPDNLTLLANMPRVYHHRAEHPAPSPVTYYRLVTGPGTAFERDGLKFEDIKDGTANTIFVVEAGAAVPWTMPDEWEYDPNGPLPPLGGVFSRPNWFERRYGKHDGTNVLFGDGNVRFLPRNTPGPIWRVLATRAGGGKVNLP